MYLTNSNEPEPSLCVITGKRTQIVKHFEIVYIKAIDNYSTIKLLDLNQFMVCNHLKNLEMSLKSSGFFRCHRSYLINLRYVKEIIRERDTYLIMLTGDKVPVSRRKTFQLSILFKKNLNNTVYSKYTTVHPEKHTAT